MKQHTTKLVIDYEASDFKRSRSFACIYCGDTTQKTRDHVVSISWSGHKRSYDKGDIVDCCRECNQMLGNVPIHSISGRASYLAARLEEKYRKIFKMPKWDSDEIEELSTHLAKMVKASINMKEYIAARISHCLKVSLDEPNTLKVKQQKISDCVAYRVLTDCFHGYPLEDVALKHRIGLNEVKKILKHNEFSSLRIGFKYERGIDFDIKLSKYFSRIRLLKKKNVQRDLEAK
jgi:hypothetical protein